MIEDRIEANKRLALERYYPPFFSILIPDLGRPQYVVKCVDSIHKYADMPVEIIVHDDGSGEEKQRVLYNELKGKVSTLIFNMGRNTGLARPINRCASMASSPYLIQFNSDAYMRSGFLRAAKEALDLPFIGLVGLASGPIGDGPFTHTTKSGFKIRLAPSAGTAFCAFKRDVYEEVGKWDENAQFQSADVQFAGTIFSKGYFAAEVEGKVHVEHYLDSEPLTKNLDYIDAYRFGRGQLNCPPVFKMDPRAHDFGCSQRELDTRMSMKRDLVNGVPHPAWYNHHFIRTQTVKLFPETGGIDWEFAKTYGHDKYKEMIIRDFKLA